MTHFSTLDNLNAAQDQVVRNFIQINYSELISFERKPLRYNLPAVVLHASKSARKMRSWKPNKNGGGSMVESPSCHRFLVLSIPGSRHVLLCFTENASQTQKVLKWSPNIYPGCQVWVMNPRVQSFVQDNAIIILNEPLIPLPDQQSENVNVFPPVNMVKAQYSSFDFVSTSVHLRSAVPVDGVCAGSFCDSQSELNPCSCTASNNQKKWCLQILFDCDEFENMNRNDVSITSMRTTKIFVDTGVLTLPLCDSNTNTVDMEDAVSVHLYLVDSLM